MDRRLVGINYYNKCFYVRAVMKSIDNIWQELKDSRPTTRTRSYRVKIRFGSYDGINQDFDRCFISRRLTNHGDLHGLVGTPPRIPLNQISPKGAPSNS